MKNILFVIVIIAAIFACNRQREPIKTGSRAGETGRLPYQVLMQTYDGDTLTFTIANDTIDIYTNTEFFNFNKVLLINGDTVEGTGASIPDVLEPDSIRYSPGVVTWGTASGFFWKIPAANYYMQLEKASGIPYIHLKVPGVIEVSEIASWATVSGVTPDKGMLIQPNDTNLMYYDGSQWIDLTAGEGGGGGDPADSSYVQIQVDSIVSLTEEYDLQLGSYLTNISIYEQEEDVVDIIYTSNNWHQFNGFVTVDDYIEIIDSLVVRGYSYLMDSTYTRLFDGLTEVTWPIIKPGMNGWAVIDTGTLSTAWYGLVMALEKPEQWLKDQKEVNGHKEIKVWYVDDMTGELECQYGIQGLTPMEAATAAQINHEIMLRYIVANENHDIKQDKEIAELKRKVDYPAKINTLMLILCMLIIALTAGIFYSIGKKISKKI